MKPKAKVTGENGNTMNVLCICTKVLKDAGKKDKIKELTERVFNAESYEDAIKIMGEYCELY